MDSTVDSLITHTCLGSPKSMGYEGVRVISEMGSKCPKLPLLIGDNMDSEIVAKIYSQPLFTNSHRVCGY